MLAYARLSPRHCAEAVTRLELAVRAVLAEERSLAAAAIAPEERQWHLTPADWPATPDDFYA